MADKSPGRAAAPVSSTTESKSFFPCAPDGQPLFAVREGLPARDALEQVSTFLAAAKDAATLAACEAERAKGGTMWACAYVLELAKSLLDGTISGMYREVGQGTPRVKEPAPVASAPEAIDPDREKILEAVRSMDMYSQDAFRKIEGLANMARRLLQLPETYSNPEDLSEALREISYTAMDIRNVINCEAGEVGAAYDDERGREAWHARLVAARQAAAKGGEADHA